MKNSKFMAIFAVLAFGLLPAFMPAQAAVPDAVNLIIAAYEEDSLALIGMLVACGVTVWGATKLGQKMGWM